MTATNSPSAHTKGDVDERGDASVFERAGDVVDDHLGAARARAHRASTQYLTTRVPSAERTVTRNTIRNPLDESGNLT